MLKAFIELSYVLSYLSCKILVELDVLKTLAEVTLHCNHLLFT